MCDSHKCLIVRSARFLKILAGDVCFVNLFRSILPVVPTECDVLIVGNIMTIIVHFTIEHQVYYDWKFKEPHAKIWENIAGAKRYSGPPWFQRCGGEGPRRPLHSDAYDLLTDLRYFNSYLVVEIILNLTKKYFRVTTGSLFSSD